MCGNDPCRGGISFAGVTRLTPWSLAEPPPIRNFCRLHHETRTSADAIVTPGQWCKKYSVLGLFEQAESHQEFFVADAVTISAISLDLPYGRYGEIAEPGRALRRKCTQNRKVTPNMPPPNAMF